MGGVWHTGRDINDVSLSGTIPPEFTGLTQRRRLSSANTLENHSTYQACIESSSTCTTLYVPPAPVAVCVSPERSCPHTRWRWLRAFRHLAVNGGHSALTPSFVPLETRALTGRLSGPQSHGVAERRAHR